MTRTSALSWMNRVRPGCLHSTQPGCQGIVCARPFLTWRPTTGHPRETARFSGQGPVPPLSSDFRPLHHHGVSCYPGSALCSHRPSSTIAVVSTGRAFHVPRLLTNDGRQNGAGFPSIVLVLAPFASLLACPPRDPSLHTGQDTPPKLTGFQDTRADTCLHTFPWAVLPDHSLLPFPPFSVF